MPNTREKLIELLNNSFDEQYSKRGLLTAPHTADHLITNDVVPVVRCNNCHNCTKSNWCNLLMMEVKGDNFCSYGERKTDNGRS